MPLIKQKKDYKIIWLPPPICLLKDETVAGIKRKRSDTLGT